MKHPFRQKRKGSLLIREFSKDVDSSELVWHRDRADRYVRVCRGKGWQLQLENKLPLELTSGKVYYIPRNTYHRVIKGQSSLVVEIREEKAVKITKRQLSRIIKEALVCEGVDPRGLKTMLKKLGVSKAFRGVSESLSEVFYEWEGDAEDMKEAVEGYHGGYRDDAGQAIDWPLDVYQQIHDLYSKKKGSYRAQRRY